MDELDKPDYAVIVKELINPGGLSTYEIAELVGGSQPTIHRIGKGHRHFDVVIGDKLRALHAKKFPRTARSVESAG